MTREFVILPEFERQWKAQGLDDNDLRNLQEQLVINPKAGDVIEGTGGLRKIRFALNGKGKRGGSRVTYVDFTVYETIYLIYTYPKNEKDNLTKEERNDIKKSISNLEESLKKRVK